MNNVDIDLLNRILSNTEYTVKMSLDPYVNRESNNIELIDPAGNTYSFTVTLGTVLPADKYVDVNIVRSSINPNIDSFDTDVSCVISNDEDNSELLLINKVMAHYLLTDTKEESIIVLYFHKDCNENSIGHIRQLFNIIQNLHNYD